MNLKPSYLKRATTLTVVLALILCQSFVTGTPLTQVVSKLRHYVSKASGGSVAKSLRLPAGAQLSVRGAVTLNGLSVQDGTTVFSGNGIKTSESSTAILSFGPMGQVELMSASDFTLEAEGSTMGGQLRTGSATIVAPAGIAVKIVTVDGPVVTDGNDAVVLTVDVTSGKTRVETSGSLASVKTPANVQLSPQDQNTQNNQSGTSDQNTQNPRPATSPTPGVPVKELVITTVSIVGGAAAGAAAGNRSNNTVSPIR